MGARVGLLLGILCGWLPLPAYAGPAATKRLTVEGWCDIAGGNLAAARDAAVRDAQKKAIEMTAGVHIQSMMSDESYSKIKDDREKFNQEVVSKIYSRTEGFIQNFNVVKEGQEGNTYKVTLALVVNDVEVMRQLSLLGKSLAGARFPKIMFLVKEEYVNKDGKAQLIEQPTLQSLLEDALLARGFDLVAKEHIDKLRSEEGAVFNDILTDDNKAAKFAMDYGAEYVVNAVDQVKYTSFNDLGEKEYHGFAKLNLKAINASSAAIVASSEQSGNSPAACFSEDELRIKAVRHVAPPLIDNLINRILESWDRETANGIRYSVKLYNVKNYRKQGIEFMKLLEKIPNVKQVKKLSFGGDRLEIEVFYPMVFDVSHLEAAIVEAVDTAPTFKNLDVTYSRGRELNFKM